MSNTDIWLGAGIAFLGSFAAFLLQYFVQGWLDRNNDLPELKVVKPPILIKKDLQWRGTVVNTGKLITCIFKRSATLITSTGSFEGEFHPPKKEEGTEVSPNSAYAIYTRYTIDSSKLEEIDTTSEASI
jgi:hypothetical protein